MAKKPEDEFEITDDDIKGISNGADVVDAVVEDETLPDKGEVKDATFEASETLKEELEALRKQNEELDAEGKRVADALAAERRAREEDAAKSAATQSELSDTRLQTIGNALAANEMSLRDAEARQVAAYEAGDFKSVAAINREITQLETKRQRMEEGKNALEIQIERDKEAPKQQRQPTLDDWFETLPTSQRDWAKTHREWFSSPAKNAKVMAAHYAATEDEGLREGSTKYFEYIETQLGIRQAPAADIDDTPAPARRQAPAAPVSRDDVSTSTGRPKSGKIRLPPEMVEAAQISGMSPSEYWAAMTPEERARVRH